MTDNATELLRKLLDERGVGYDTRDGKAVKNTYWNIGDLRFGYCEQIYEDGQHETDLFMYRGYGCTPERAIAATIGNGTLTADDVLNAVYKHGARWQAIADELNSRVKPPCGGGYCPLCGAYDEWESYENSVPATEENMAKFGLVRERTCVPTEDGCCPYCSDDLIRCDMAIGEGGGAVELDPPIYHNYCPNCGCKVVGE